MDIISPGVGDVFPVNDWLRDHFDDVGADRREFDRHVDEVEFGRGQRAVDGNVLRNFVFLDGVVAGDASDYDADVRGGEIERDVRDVGDGAGGRFAGGVGEVRGVDDVLRGDVAAFDLLFGFSASLFEFAIDGVGMAKFGDDVFGNHVDRRGVYRAGLFCVGVDEEPIDRGGGELCDGVDAFSFKSARAGADSADGLGRKILFVYLDDGAHAGLCERSDRYAAGGFLCEPDHFVCVHDV